VIATDLFFWSGLVIAVFPVLLFGAIAVVLGVLSVRALREQAKRRSGG